jgi:apolipoprotein N-acyltransferase
MTGAAGLTARARQRVQTAHHWIMRQPEKSRLRLAFATGLVSAAAFAPLDIWPLMLLAFAILLVLMDATASVAAAARLGWSFSFGQLLFGLYWIAVAWQYQASMPVILGLLAVIILSAGLALFAALACGLARKFWHTGTSRIFLLAAAWAFAEWLRGFVLTGFPWNLVGSAWLPVLPVAQAAAVIGSNGLSIFMVVAGSALAVAFTDDTVPAKRRGQLLAATLTVFAAGLLYILLAATAFWPKLQLHIVQANIGQEAKWSDENFRKPLQLHLAMTRAIIAERGPGIVIWPETAIPNLIDEEVTTRYLVSRALGEDSLLFTGADRVLRSPEGEALAAYNSLMILDSNGQIRNMYDKVHLVPFGEYLPWRNVLDRLGLARLAPGSIDFLPGPGLRTLEVDGLPNVGPLICYEAIFPGQVVDAKNRPAWLLNISNDAWFGRSFGPYQHLAQARLRSIEEGLPMIRSTPTGISAVIDGHGRLLARSPSHQPYVLTTRLPKPLAATPYARFGDLVFLLFAALTLFAGRRRAARG